MRDQHQTTENETPLQGWKEIAAYLERDQRTARRWEAEEGLPVRRYRSARRSSVYAYPSEIETWRTSRPVAKESASETGAPEEPQGAQSRTWVWSAVAAAMLLTAFIYILRSPELNPFVEAQSGIVTTEIFHGDTVGKVSPDGRYLSETDWVNSGDIGIRDLQTGEYRRLGDKTAWTAELGEADASIFSRDGQQIAYNWLAGTNDDNWYELRTIEAFAENPQPRVIFKDPDVRYLEPEAWTNDGRILLWIEGQNSVVSLAFVTLDTGDLEIVKSFDPGTNSPRSSAWSATLSPDDAWIAYELSEIQPESRQALPPDVFVISVDGQTEAQVTRHQGEDRLMGFAPDGDELLFVSDRTGNFSLWGVPVESGTAVGEPTILLRDLGNAKPLGVLADGSVSYVRSVGTRDLMSAEIDPTTGQVLRSPQVLETRHLGSNLGPWFSPDEKHMAYISSQFIHVRNVDTGAETDFDLAGMRVEGGGLLRWSPDQKRLLARATAEGESKLVDISLADGSVRVLAGPEAPMLPLGWLADEQTIVYRRPNSLGTLTLGQLNGQDFYTGNAPGFKVLATELSPQRDRVAWREFPAEEEPDLIKVMSVGGGDDVVLVRAEPGEVIGMGLGWANDGSAVLFDRFDAQGDRSDEVLWIAPLDGTSPFQTELMDRRIRNPAILSDGKTLVYQRGNTDPRIFRTQNFLPAAGGE